MIMVNGEALVITQGPVNGVGGDRARINVVVRLNVALTGQVNPEVTSSVAPTAGFVLAVVVVRFGVHHFPVKFVVRHVSL